MNDSANNPLVSIVVRSMGRPELAQALGAIARQDYAPIEVVVVDATGGAHPPLPRIEWREGHTVRLLQPGRRLIRPLAAQAGLDALAGDWFGFLDDDDTCEPAHVSSLVAAARAHSDTVVVYGRGSELDPQGVLMRTFGRPFNRALMHFSPLLFWQSALIATRVRALGAHFDPQFEVCEDRDFLAQCEALGRFVFVPGLATFRFRPDLGTSGTAHGSNRDAMRMARFETLLRAKWAGTGSWHHERAASRCASGIRAYRAGDAEGARRAFLSVLDEYPGDPNALHALARVALARGAARSALLHAEAALEVNPFPAEYRATLAEARSLLDARSREARSPPVASRAPPMQAPPSRNASCPCGSGQRYKACCGRAVGAPPPVAAPAAIPLAASATPAADDALAVAALAVQRGEAMHALAVLKDACTAGPTRARVLAGTRIALSLDNVATALAMLAPLAAQGSDAEIDQLLQACGDRQHYDIATASLWRRAHERAVARPAADVDSNVPDTLAVDAEGPDPGAGVREPARVVIRMRNADPAPLVRCMARIDDRWPGVAMTFTRPALDTPAGGSPMPVCYPEIDLALFEIEAPSAGERTFVGRQGPARSGEEHPDDGALLRALMDDGHALALPESAFLERAFADEPSPRRPHFRGDESPAMALARIDIALFRAAPQRRGIMDDRILAAMAAGRAVVVFADTLAAHEWIDNGDSGFIVVTPEEARERIAVLAASADLRRRIGLAARVRVKALLEDQRERLGAVYRGVRRNV